jgi:hypothetical protein
LFLKKFYVKNKQLFSREQSEGEKRGSLQRREAFCFSPLVVLCVLCVFAFNKLVFFSSGIVGAFEDGGVVFFSS